MEELTPKQIVKELDRFIVGQLDAKKSVAIALRNRFRRQLLKSPLKEEVLPKNILMIGSTGVGKTEIARRLANLVSAPFIKVEATKFTEIGYVGRDVEQIIRDLVEISIVNQKDLFNKKIYPKACKLADERIVSIIANEKSCELTKDQIKEMLLNKDLENREIEIFIKDAQQHTEMSMFDIPGNPGMQMGMLNLGDLFGKGSSQKAKKRKMKIKDARKIFEREESEKLIDNDKIVTSAIEAVEENGIVFIDEIDKVCNRNDHSGSGNVSREGVQRDLLPLIEGCTVPTKRGPIKTEHILFIASGAFHISKPSDLLPELQGRLPIVVEFNPLTKEDFIKILSEPETSLIKQYKALLATEGLNINFLDDGIVELADIASELNTSVENIGARRLHTLMEKLLENVSFNYDEYKGMEINIDSNFVRENLKDLYKKTDLSKFIL